MIDSGPETTMPRWLSMNLEQCCIEGRRSHENVDVFPVGVPNTRESGYKEKSHPDMSEV